MISEFGDSNLTTQAEALRQYIAYARGVVSVAVWFCLSDLSADNGETFGLMDRNGTRRWSYNVAKAMFTK